MHTHLSVGSASARQSGPGWCAGPRGSQRELPALPSSFAALPSSLPVLNSAEMEQIADLHKRIYDEVSARCGTTPGHHPVMPCPVCMLCTRLWLTLWCMNRKEGVSG